MTIELKLKQKDRARSFFVPILNQIPGGQSPGTYLQDLQWNPVTANLLSVVYSNGSLAIFSINDESSKPPDCWTLPPAEGVTCINWSPKGKQLVAGEWHTCDPLTGRMRCIDSFSKTL